MGCDFKLKFDAPSNPPLLPMCCHVVCLVLRGYRCRVSSADFCKKIIYVLSYQCQQPLIRYKYLSIHVDLHYYGFQLYLLLVYGTGEPVVEDATSASTTLDNGYCVSESILLSSSTRMLIASTSSSSSPSLPVSGAPMLPRNRFVAKTGSGKLRMSLMFLIAMSQLIPLRLRTMRIARKGMTLDKPSASVGIDHRRKERTSG